MGGGRSFVLALTWSKARKSCGLGNFSELSSLAQARCLPIRQPFLSPPSFPEPRRLPTPQISKQKVLEEQPSTCHTLCVQNLNRGQHLPSHPHPTPVQVPEGKSRWAGVALTFARSCQPPGPQGRTEDDSREHGEGDQRDGQAEHGQRAADVADGRERHLVSACELCGKQSGGGQPSGPGPTGGLAQWLVPPEPD